MFKENNWYRRSYSQDGEDVVLASFYQGYYSNDYKGFYIDIGAHHPLRFSNTQYFNELGWEGINIDATPGSMIKFNELRPNDTNLEIGISDIESDLIYYTFDDGALNTFSKERADFVINESPYKLKDKIKVKTYKLSTVFDKYVKNNQTIDFINIDIEGLDFQVLKTTNWDKYKPNFILIEDKQENLESILSSEIYKYLSDLEYNFIAKTHRTMIYKYNKIL